MKTSKEKKRNIIAHACAFLLLITTGNETKKSAPVMEPTDCNFSAWIKSIKMLNFKSYLEKCGLTTLAILAIWNCVHATEPCNITSFDDLDDKDIEHAMFRKSIISRRLSFPRELSDRSSEPIAILLPLSQNKRRQANRGDPVNPMQP